MFMLLVITPGRKVVVLTPVVFESAVKYSKFDSSGTIQWQRNCRNRSGTSNEICYCISITTEIRYDSTNQKVYCLLLMVQTHHGEARVGTVSGTSFSFGSSIICNLDLVFNGNVVLVLIR